MNTRNRRTRSLLVIFALLVVGSVSLHVNGQTPTPSPEPTVPEAPPADPTPPALPAQAPAEPAHPTAAPKKGPALDNYKGIKIGTTTSEVRKKLGSPTDKGDEQDFYVFSDHETAQFFYDSDHKVKAIAVTYTGNLSSALTPMQVFGHDVAPNAEGAISNLERYPDAGFWVSYNRTAGESPIISVAMQKM